MWAIPGAPFGTESSPVMEAMGLSSPRLTGHQPFVSSGFNKENGKICRYHTSIDLKKRKKKNKEWQIDGFSMEINGIDVTMSN